MLPELFGYESLSFTLSMSALEYPRHQFTIACSIFSSWLNASLDSSTVPATPPIITSPICTDDRAQDSASLMYGSAQDLETGIGETQSDTFGQANRPCARGICRFMFDMRFRCLLYTPALSRLKRNREQAESARLWPKASTT
jgi:hypothetical protein